MIKIITVKKILLNMFDFIKLLWYNIYCKNTVIIFLRWDILWITIILIKNQKSNWKEK